MACVFRATETRFSKPQGRYIRSDHGSSHSPSLPAAFPHEFWPLTICIFCLQFRKQEADLSTSLLAIFMKVLSGKRHKRHIKSILNIQSSAKTTKILVTAMLCLYTDFPPFYLSFSYSTEILRNIMYPWQDFQYYSSSHLLFSQPTFSSISFPCCRRATRRCRSPGSCTAVTTPPPATCCSTL